METSDKKKILVVEDEPFISGLCMRVLISEGYEVNVAVNGQIAEGMIDRCRYDLCLVDIRTPIMSGKELFKYIKEKHPYLVKGVIFTTGDVIGGDTQSFLKDTGCAYILKPFSPDDLRTVIKEAMQSITKLV